MKKIRFGMVCGVALILSAQLSAQTYTKGNLKYEGDVNFNELANYYKTHPQINVQKPPREEEENELARPVRPEPDPSMVHYFNAEKLTGLPELPVSPAPNDSFQSTLTNGTNIPPDTHGAVGKSDTIIAADNYQVKMQHRNGTTISAVTLDTWWGVTGSFDPRVHYDPYKNKWIMVTDAGGAGAGLSKLWIAISTTSNPGGTWHKYSITIDASNHFWLDFPNVGFNNQWVVITGNMFTVTNDTPYGANVYVIDYNSMIAGSGAPYTKFTQGNSFSICPALTYSATEPNMYAIEEYHDYAGQLEVWQISGPVGSPAMNPVGWPTSTTHWNNSSYANNPYTSTTPPGSDFGPQSGTTNKLQTNDDRINNCVFRNGTLWTSHSVFLPYSATANPTRSSVMWWQIDTNGVALQNCLIDDATAAHFYGFPSIAVNANNDAVVGFSVMSSTTHPSATYAYHSHLDPISTIRPNYVYRHGLATYYVTFGGGKNRWGDYSATCVDPLNDFDFWTNQESVATTNNWDTWWAHIQAPPVAVSDVQLVEAANVNIIPNPNNGTFDIVFEKQIDKSFNVRISDLQGKIVYEKSFSATISGNKVSIITKDLPNGIYMAAVELDGNVTNKKVEIIR